MRLEPGEPTFHKTYSRFQLMLVHVLSGLVLPKQITMMIARGYILPTLNREFSNCGFEFR